MGADTTTLNTAFDSMAGQATQEVTNQAKAKIVQSALLANDQMSILALTASITNLGTEVAVGQAAQFFEEIVDLSTQAGQAIVGAMREGRNQVQLDSVGISRYDTVPDTQNPPPAEAVLSDRP
jgi:hypothetical protein